MTARLRFSLFWRFQIFGWLIFAIATFPLKWVVLDSIHAALIVSLYREGMGFLVTSGMHGIYRRFYRERMGVGALCLLILTVSLIGACVQTYLCLAFHDVFDLDEEKIFKNMVIFAILYFRGGLCLGWSFLYFVIKLWFEKTDRELRAEREKTKRHEAEAQMLRAQMNPHFLFNAFNTILAEIGILNSGLRATVQALADYLRYSLANRNRERVELRKEMEAMRNLLTVEEARYPGELKIECFIEEKALDVLVPGILLQPLVENAIKYGRKTSPRPLTVNLTITRPTVKLIKIEVANTGQWIPPQNQRIIGGIGLKNVRQRLALLYPEGDWLHTREENGWVIVELQIPIVP